MEQCFLPRHPSGTAVLNFEVNGNNNGAGLTNRGGLFVAEIPRSLEAGPVGSCTPWPVAWN